MKLFKFILVALTVFAVSSCMKDDTPQFDYEARLEEEKPLIAEYVAAHYPNAIQSTDYPGIWYEVISEGEVDSYEYKYNSGINEIIIPTISVNYYGKLLNGNEFDKNDSEAGWTTSLGTVIPAWQIAFLPKKIGEYQAGGLTESGLQKEAEIVLITPSFYAYGNQARGPIPANSPLVFTLKVLDIKDQPLY